MSQAKFSEGDKVRTKNGRIGVIRDIYETIGFNNKYSVLFINEGIAESYTEGFLEADLRLAEESLDIGDVIKTADDRVGKVVGIEVFPENPEDKVYTVKVRVDEISRDFCEEDFQIHELTLVEKYSVDYIRYLLGNGWVESEFYRKEYFFERHVIILDRILAMSNDSQNMYLVLTEDEQLEQVLIAKNFSAVRGVLKKS